MPEAIDSPHYDAALEAALRLLEMFDTAGDVPRPILLSTVTFLILEAIRQARHLPPGGGRPSAS
jgi:hypothetical protein